MGGNPGDAAYGRRRQRLTSQRSWGFLLGLLLLSWPFLLPACRPPESGRQITSEEPRVVSLVPSLNELIIALGAGEHLVARTDFDTHPEISGLPSIGEGLDPNLESMVTLGVDMVLTPGGRDVAALHPRFGRLGMEVHAIPTNTMQDLFDAVARLGGLFGMPQAADSLARRMEEEMRGIVERVEGRKPVTVMYVVAADPPMTSGEGTFVDELVRIAGGRNVFGDAGHPWPSVGFESIVSRDPEVLIWPRGDHTAVTVESLRSAPGWQDVPAVREGRVLFVDVNLFSRPGPGFPEAARTLAQALHPGAFQPPSLPML